MISLNMNDYIINLKDNQLEKTEKIKLSWDDNDYYLTVHLKFFQHLVNYSPTIRKELKHIHEIDLTSVQDVFKDTISLPVKKKLNFTKNDVQDLYKEIKKEFEEKGYMDQFIRDSKLWYLTMKSPGNEKRKEIIQRIFTVIRYGNLHIKTSEGKFIEFSELGFPIATAISHGSRVIIQLPKTKLDNNSEKDQSFWKWLITGNKDGNLGTYITSSTTGNEAEEHGRLLFKRYAATHGIHQASEEEIEKLPNGKMKYVVEEKTIGLNLRDTKILVPKEYVLLYHRHYGMNIPFGGNGNTTIFNENISANGEFGHFYFYTKPSSNDKNGVVMIGLEESEYGKRNQYGKEHTLKAEASHISISLGLKWKDLGFSNLNSLFIDLSEGWEFLEGKEKNFHMNWLFETCKIKERKSSGINFEKNEELIEHFKKEIKSKKEAISYTKDLQLVEEYFK